MKYTFAELLKDRIQLIRVIKIEFQNEIDLVKRAQNFKAFVRYCRDRKFDAVAGHTKGKNNMYHWGY